MHQLHGEGKTPESASGNPAVCNHRLHRIVARTPQFIAASAPWMRARGEFSPKNRYKLVDKPQQAAEKDI